MKKTLTLLIVLVFVLSGCSTTASQVKSDDSSESFFPSSFAKAKYIGNRGDVINKDIPRT